MDSCNEFIETMSLSLDIDYSGNFQLSVDTKMKFGKTAFLSITGKLKTFPHLYTSRTHGNVQHINARTPF